MSSHSAECFEAKGRSSLRHFFYVLDYRLALETDALSSALAVSFAEKSLLVVYLLEWWIWNRENQISEVLLSPRCSGDRHTKSDRRDGVHAALMTVAWRGQGPSTSTLRMPMRMLARG